MMDARAGELRDRISIEVNNRTRSAGGVFADDWVEFARAWARIDPTGGREFYGGREVVEESTIEIWIRWQPNLTTKMRVRYDDPKIGQTRYFNIRNMSTVSEIRAWIILRCEEYQEGQERVN